MQNEEARSWEVENMKTSKCNFLFYEISLEDL